MLGLAVGMCQLRIAGEVVNWSVPPNIDEHDNESKVDTSRPKGIPIVGAAKQGRHPRYWRPVHE